MRSCSRLFCCAAPFAAFAAMGLEICTLNPTTPTTSGVSRLLLQQVPSLAGLMLSTLKVNHTNYTCLHRSVAQWWHSTFTLSPQCAQALLEQAFWSHGEQYQLLVLWFEKRTDGLLTSKPVPKGGLNLYGRDG